MTTIKNEQKSQNYIRFKKLLSFIHYVLKIKLHNMKTKRFYFAFISLEVEYDVDFNEAKNVIRQFYFRFYYFTSKHFGNSMN